MTTDNATATTDAASTTTYVMLKLGSAQDGSEVWTTVRASVSARDASAAIRSTVEQLAEKDQDGTFVAVPSRSWRPVKVSAKVERTLIVEDAA